MGRELLTSASYLPIRLPTSFFPFPSRSLPLSLHLSPVFLLFFTFSRDTPFDASPRLLGDDANFANEVAPSVLRAWKSVHDRTVCTGLRGNAWNVPSEKRKAEEKGNGRVETCNIPCSDFYAANKRVLVPAGNSSGSKVARRRVGGR